MIVHTLVTVTVAPGHGHGHTTCQSPSLVTQCANQRYHDSLHHGDCRQGTSLHGSCFTRAGRITCDYWLGLQARYKKKRERRITHTKLIRLLVGQLHVALQRINLKLYIMHVRMCTAGAHQAALCSK